MKNIENKNGVKAIWVPFCTGGRYEVASSVGAIRVSNGFFEKKNWMYYEEITKRFSELSADCQNWLIELAKTEFQFLGNGSTNPLGRKVPQFYWELTGTGIYCYSSFDCGIDINDVRYYLVNEGVAKLN